MCVASRSRRPKSSFLWEAPLTQRWPHPWPSPPWIWQELICLIFHLAERASKSIGSHTCTNTLNRSHAQGRRTIKSSWNPLIAFQSCIQTGRNLWWHSDQRPEAVVGTHNKLSSKWNYQRQWRILLIYRESPRQPEPEIPARDKLAVSNWCAMSKSFPVLLLQGLDSPSTGSDVSDMNECGLV